MKRNALFQRLLNISLSLMLIAALVLGLVGSQVGGVFAQEEEPTPEVTIEPGQEPTAEPPLETPQDPTEDPPTEVPTQPADPDEGETPVPTDEPAEMQAEPQDEPPHAPQPADAPIHSSAGTIRNVATTGSDSGDCSVTPCATVDYASNQAVSGDTIHIQAGTYSNTNVSVNGKNLTIIGEGMQQTILDGGGTGRVFSFLNAETYLKDLTIQNGTTTDVGGGIRSDGYYLNLERISLINNTAGSGGGLFRSGRIDMRDVQVSGNTANHEGFTGHGGGILIKGDLSINNNLENVTLSANTASGVGGGIAFEGYSNYYLTNVTISGNAAQHGGGLSAQNSGPIVVMLHVTISNNGATDGAPGGIFNRANMDFKNSIIAKNSPFNCGGDYLIGTSGHNLDSGHSCFNLSTGDIQDTDPLLLPLADNGSFTPTHALSLTSPALEAGDYDIRAPTDQRGLIRPQDGNGDGIAICDMGAYELEAPKTFRSTGSYDGWLLESSRTSSKGGSKNSTATTLRVGDDKYNRQYRSILHFNTSELDDNAVIVKAQLKIRRSSITGTNPFKTHGALYVDMRKGAFSGSNALQLSDWQAAASKLAAGIIKNSSTSWHTLNLSSANFDYINLAGVTQLRLRFYKQDNGDKGADYVSFYSGNAVSANRPKLIITYYVP